jgi:polysaccharide biosynthesis transport protein
MLEMNRTQTAPDETAANEPSAAELFTYALGVVRRQIFLVLLFAMLGAGLGVVMFLRASPPYTATATLLVDTHKIEVLQQSAVSEGMSIGSVGAMDSQIELLKSDELALSVIKKLGLWDDPRFVGDGKPGILMGLLAKYLPVLTPKRSELTDPDRMARALVIFNKSLTVDRVGAAYAIEIGFESRDADLAAKVANEVANSYNDLQQTSETEAARRASTWLETRIPELRAKSEAAQRAVVEYKTEHNIVQTGGGQLISDQRVADLNARWNTARDETFKAKARFDQLAAVGSAEDLNGIGNSVISEDDKKGVLATLRNNYFDVTAKEVESSAKLGPNNPNVVALRNQEAQLRSQLRSETQAELQQLKQSSGSDYEAAKLRESQLKEEFDVAVLQGQAANQAQVKLQDLEASARAYQDLYNSFLGRYNASLQQAATPVATANLISPATPPAQKDYKKTFKITALFPVAGLALGLGTALMRELLAGRAFRTSKSIQSRLRMACLGVLPKVERVKRPRRLKRGQNDAAPRTLVRGDRGVSWTAVDYPLSRFSEGIRSIKLAIDMDKRSGKVIGFTSSIPNEGKSTVALAVGQLIARNGASVIVVDCDLRNPSLTRSVAPGAANGIVDLVTGGASLEDVVWKDRSTQMAFLPAIPRPGPPDSPTILASVELKRMIDQLRTLYEYVIVDLSPIAPVIDVSATTEFIDSYVLVIEWGRTTIDLVEHALRIAPNVSRCMMGAVLNKANVKKLESYDPYLSGYGDYYLKQHKQNELTYN